MLYFRYSKLSFWKSIVNFCCCGILYTNCFCGIMMMMIFPLFLNRFAEQLRMYCWNVIVVLGLIEVSGNKLQFILADEIFSWRIRSTQCGMVWHVWRVEFNLSFNLLEHQEYITMQASSVWRPWPDELIHGLAWAQIVTCDVDGQPMTEFATLWFFTRWGVGVFRRRFKG